MTTRLTVDWTACDGRGLCAELLPELLDRDPWGYPVPHRPGPIEVPDHLVGHAEKAAALCPLLAVRLGLPTSAVWSTSGRPPA